MKAGLRFSVLAAGAFGLVLSALWPQVLSAETGGAVAAAKTGTLEGFQLQDLDEPLTQLVPAKPRTVSEQDRIEALARFGAGRLLEQRSDFQGAYQAYEKAIQLDPNSIGILHALIPLAFSLNRTEDGLKYSIRAVELDPGDLRLLRRLGATLANAGDSAGAIRLFERALKSKDLDKQSSLYVTLMRDLGVLYYTAGKVPEAADCLTVVFDSLQNQAKYKLDEKTRRELLADPNVDYEKLGQVFLEAQRSELALQAFEVASKGRRGKAGNLSFNLAQVYVQTKQGEKALAELQKYLEAQRQSKGDKAYELLAEILTMLDRKDDLIPQLEELAAKDLHNSALQYYLAKKYLEAQRLDDAERVLKKTIESAAEVQGYAGLASIYRQRSNAADLLTMLAKGYTRGKGLEGIATELKALEQDQPLSEKLIQIGKEKADSDPPQLDYATSFVLANIAENIKQTDAVEKFYRFALSTRKGKVEEIYEQLGQYYMGLKDYAQAGKVFREASDDAALADNRPNFLFLLSQVLEMGGDTPAALEAIQTAKKLIPNHPLLHYQEGWIYYHSQKYPEAIEQFEKVITSFPENKPIVRRAQFSLSNVYVQKGELRKGEEILEVILKENPEDPSVNNDLGYLYADQGKNLEQAEQMIAKALKAEPENVAYLDSMGWVLFKLGKYAEAVPHLEKAVGKLSGGDDTIWDHLGDVYDRLQQPAKALEAWKKALEGAKASTTPDKKLIERIEEKIKNHSTAAGKLNPQRPNSP